MVVLGGAGLTFGAVRANAIAEQLIGHNAVWLDDLLDDAFAVLLVIVTTARIVVVLYAAIWLRIYGVLFAWNGLFIACVRVVAGIGWIGNFLIWIRRIRRFSIVFS